jgi:hypothetical protein
LNDAKGCHSAAFLRQLGRKRALTVVALAEYAGGFVEQYNLLWRKEFRFDPTSVALLRQYGSGDFTSPQVRLFGLTRAAKPRRTRRRSGPVGLESLIYDNLNNLNNLFLPRGGRNTPRKGCHESQ